MSGNSEKERARRQRSLHGRQGGLCARCSEAIGQPVAGYIEKVVAGTMALTNLQLICGGCYGRQSTVQPDQRIPLYEAQGGRCAKCFKAIPHAKAAHVDYIVPIAKGGLPRYANLCCICGECRGPVAGLKPEPTVKLKPTQPPAPRVVKTGPVGPVTGWAAPAGKTANPNERPQSNHARQNRKKRWKYHPSTAPDNPVLRREVDEADLVVVPPKYQEG